MCAVKIDKPDHVVINNVYGSGECKIEAPESTSLEIQKLTVNGSGSIILGNQGRLRNLTIGLRGDGNKISIGDNFSCGGLVLIARYANISIGHDVLFSQNIHIRTHDMHDIFDVETGECVNPATDVVIKDHVWIGEKVTILPGVTINNDSVIGAGSIVSSDIEANSIAAGTPAKIIRRGINWKK